MKPLLILIILATSVLGQSPSPSPVDSSLPTSAVAFPGPSPDKRMQVIRPVAPAAQVIIRLNPAESAAFAAFMLQQYGLAVPSDAGTVRVILTGTSK